MANWVVVKDDVVKEGNQVFRVSVSASNGVDDKFNKVYLVKSEDELIALVQHDIEAQEGAKVNEVKFTKGVLSVPVVAKPSVDIELTAWLDARRLYRRLLVAVDEGYYAMDAKVVSDAKADVVSKFKDSYIAYLGF